MIATMRSWFEGRSGRERMLLAAMAVLAAGVLVWLGVARPAAAWREAAAERRAAASADLALLRAADGSGAALSAAEVQVQARQTAAAAGLNLVLEARPDGADFTLSAASTTALFGWLATLQGAHGIEARALVVSENADATLDARGTLTGGHSAR